MQPNPGVVGAEPNELLGQAIPPRALSLDPLIGVSRLEPAGGRESGTLCQGPMDLENRCKISVSRQPRWVACTASMYRNRCPSSSEIPPRMVNGFHYCRDERSAKAECFPATSALSLAGDDPDGAVIDLDRIDD